MFTDLLLMVPFTVQVLVRRWKQEYVVLRYQKLEYFGTERASSWLSHHCAKLLPLVHRGEKYGSSTIPRTRTNTCLPAFDFSGIQRRWHWSRKTEKVEEELKFHNSLAKQSDLLVSWPVITCRSYYFVERGKHCCRFGRACVFWNVVSRTAFGTTCDVRYGVLELGQTNSCAILSRKKWNWSSYSDISAEKRTHMSTAKCWWSQEDSCVDHVAIE